MSVRRTDPLLDADLFQVPAGPGAVHVERYGQGGHAIVLLHGFGTSSFLWRSVAPALAAAGYTALAVDLMGYGESDRPVEADYSIAEQAEYVRRAMLAMRVSRFTVAGVDIGGGVALRLAAMSPASVDGLVLINSVGFDECPGRDVREVQRATARFALRIARDILGVASVLREPLERSVVDPAAMPDGLVARYLAPYVGQSGVTHLLALAGALKAEDVQELDLGTIVAPSLIVWGEADPWLAEGLPQRLHEAIPGSALVRLPAVGRLSPEEVPET
ncbi:MAG: alpha/beta hydrolase, partial [Gemmatimonadota bacterium]|nr:alpha/beta hydrolase [Gemmatimonadota bacterium]